MIHFGASCAFGAPKKERPKLTEKQAQLLKLLHDGWNVYTTRASNSFFVVKRGKKRIANYESVIGLIRTGVLIKGDIEGQKIPYYMSLEGREIEA